MQENNTFYFVLINAHFLNKQIIHNDHWKNSSNIILFNTAIKQVISLHGYSKIVCLKKNKKFTNPECELFQFITQNLKSIYIH